jgi:hypothetical protein
MWIFAPEHAHPIEKISSGIKTIREKSRRGPVLTFAVD